jgi:hypothetical protein
MTDRTRQQVILLVLLVGVLAAVLAYQMWGGSPATGRAPSSNRTASTAAAGDVEPVTDIRLDLLEREPPAYRPEQRNPFRFRPRPAPVVRPAAPPPLPPPPMVTGPPPLPPIRIRYVGFLVEPSGKNVVAMLRDEVSGALVTASAGDIIDGRYRLLNVSRDAVEIAYLDGRGRQRIVRSGQ